MMSESTLERLLAAWDGGEVQPPDLPGTVAMADAFPMMMQTLTRRQASGLVVSGWKLGQTNAKLRAERGEAHASPGFMLAQNQHMSGSELDVGGPYTWFLEPELALVLKSELRGTDVTADDVSAAIGGIASSFEVVGRRPGWDDRALQRGVNGSSAGYVLGDVMPGCPSAAELDEMKVVCTCDNKVIAEVRGGDVRENPLESTAWLARFLAPYGAALQPGHVILTGTYAGLLPVQPGEYWRSQIGDLGTVEINIR
jgi:2-keto-4-pentenoate hydratase